MQKNYQGEVQSISIVRALLREPAILLMDEPINTLDESRQQALYKHIEKMTNAIIIIITYRKLQYIRGKRCIEINI